MDNFIYKNDTALQSLLCQKILITFKDEGFTSNSNTEDFPIDFTKTPKDNPKFWFFEVVRKIVEDNFNQYRSIFDLGLSRNNLSMSQYSSVKQHKKEEEYTSYDWVNSINNKSAFTWVLYLNTVESGGGTQFLYQNKIENAREGKLILWPTHWTHTYRKIPSFSEDTYSITGGLEIHK